MFSPSSPEIGGSEGAGQNVSDITASIVSSLSQTSGVDSAAVHVAIQQTSELELAIDPDAFAALSEAARALLLSQQEAAYSQAICGSTEVDLGGGASVALTCSVSAQQRGSDARRRRRRLTSVPMLVVTRTLGASASLDPPSVNTTTLSIALAAAQVNLTAADPAAAACILLDAAAPVVDVTGVSRPSSSRRRVLQPRR